MHYSSEGELKHCVRRHIQIVRLDRVGRFLLNIYFSLWKRRGRGWPVCSTALSCLRGSSCKLWGTWVSPELNILCRLRQEMQNFSHCSLIDGGQDTVSLCLANLILTGRATPFLHNGTISARSQHDDELQEMIGIIERLRHKLLKIIILIWW